MLSTTVDMYQGTLDSINKNRTEILTPEKWNRLINLAQMDYCREHIVNGEVVQKRIDDLRMIYVVADIAAITDKTFPLPNGTTVQNLTGTILPLYMRLLGTAFKINYVNNICDLTGLSDWIYNVHIMKSGRRNMIKRSPFRRPTDAKIYQRQLENIVEIDTGTASTAAIMHIEYFRWPDTIFYNENAPGDTGNPLTGSVNCILPPEQRQEIVDLAARIYVERAQDPRYRTILAEEQIKGQSK